MKISSETLRREGYTDFFVSHGKLFKIFGKKFITNNMHEPMSPVQVSWNIVCEGECSPDAWSSRHVSVIKKLRCIIVYTIQGGHKVSQHPCISRTTQDIEKR